MRLAHLSFFSIPRPYLTILFTILCLAHCLYREDEYLVNMQHTVIPSWYQREGYIKAMANLIQSELEKFGSPGQVDNLVSARSIIYIKLFSSGKKEFQVFCSFLVLPIQLYPKTRFKPKYMLQVVIFFSAHGVPLAYVEEAGDPYKAEMEECVDLIMEELDKRKITNAYTLAYQVFSIYFCFIKR